jgi:hypothetical protein
MTTLEQERRELWDGLLDGMRDSDDPACAAACRRLLRHLVASNFGVINGTKVGARNVQLLQVLFLRPDRKPRLFSMS